MNEIDIEVGDEVRHPIAGRGTVFSIKGETNNSMAHIKYVDGSRGGARIGDLEKIESKPTED